MQHGGDVPWHAALGAGKNRVSRLAGAGGIRRRVSSSDYPSDVMLEAARASNADAIKKGTVRMLRGTVERIPYEEFFDKAFARNSFHLWPDRRAGLWEIQRVPKRGGTLVLSFDGPARRVVDLGSVRNALQEAGFERIDNPQAL